MVSSVLQDWREGEREDERGVCGGLFLAEGAMAKVSVEELRDWFRYTELKPASFLQGDLEEVAALEAKYPSPVSGFLMRWKRMVGLLKPLPTVFGVNGGKRKRTRRTRR